MSVSPLPPLIRRMKTADFYPHSVSAPIELIQTHASYVLLTGDYAYKIKKPVNFGFLDYSTLAARKHFVFTELRLNQRTASELYLDAVTIWQSGQDYNLNGIGHPVEYAVKMRQFPSGCLFSDLLAADELASARMEELAQRVAELHQQSAIGEHISSFGTLSRIRQAFDENYAQTQPYIGRGQTTQQLRETRAYTDHVFVTWGDRFQQRINQHKICEGHGDLHLGNVCWWQDRVFLFDCIEFNEAFRYVDCMYDVAFPVMDCDAWGRSDLGNIFLNTYLEETGDWEGVCILPLYLSRQAYVRAKVTSFLQEGAGGEAQQQLQNRAANYYRLAWQYTRPREGRLVMMSGLSGSGKSTVSRQLAAHVGAIHIRSDAVRKHLAGVPLRQRGEASLYTSAQTQQTYRRLLELGLLLAQEGQTVILDAKYDRLNHRRAVLSEASVRNIPVSILLCKAPMPCLRKRLQQRTGDIADATAEILDAQQATYQPLTAQEQSMATVIDTTEDIDWGGIQQSLDLLDV